MPKRKQVGPEEVAVPHGAATLFHQSDPRLLVCLDFDGITETEFLSVLAHAKPRFAIDLRAAPRFDLGSMNRRLVFTLMEQWHIHYVDISGAFGVRQAKGHNLEPYKLVEALNNSIFKRANKPIGPLLFIVDTPQLDDVYIQSLALALEPLSDAGWEILRLPEFEYSSTKTTPRREIIFISHATPEQNDFAKWLGAQLSLAGYRVWFDVGQLKGGETFWDEIETVIRQEAGKVIVAVTSAAQQKPGVLDEVNLAIGIERSLGIENFVIPLRVDAIPYDQFRANLARKNIIDFANNWAEGLSKLLESLERDGFPKSNLDGLSDAATLAHQRLTNRQKVSSEPEDVQLNWVEIFKLPPFVRFHEYGNILPSVVDSAVASFSFPLARYLRLTVGFATAEEVASFFGIDVPVLNRCEVSLEEFLANGTCEFPGIKPPDAHNIVKNLLRQAWSNKSKSIGLKEYTTANNAVAWYAPTGLIPNDQVSFTDVAGVRRRKKLVGYSRRRSVFWHFALEMKPVLTSPRHFVIKSHVVFSTDGVNPISSTAKMHVLRRSFCRSWWNDRWRDLTAAYLVFLAGGENDIPIFVDKKEELRISSTMMRVTSPVSIREPDSMEALGEDGDLDFDLEEDVFVAEELAEIDKFESDLSDE